MNYSFVYTSILFFLLENVYLGTNAWHYPINTNNSVYIFKDMDVVRKKHTNIS
jgi:hypothetical protein